MVSTHIGAPVSRVEARAKVTGQAKYAADYNFPGMLYGHIVSSAIAYGRIKNIHAEAALKLDGVAHVFTHENVKGLPWFDLKYKDLRFIPGSPFRPLYDDKILFSQQPVALIVAETPELARYAASLVHIEYEASDFETGLLRNVDKARKVKGMQSRGKAERALEKADRRISAEYFHGAEHHNPIELFGATVIYEEHGKLIVYDKTQGVINSQVYISHVFGLKKKNVRVLAPFVGGAFGSGLRPQYSLFMAVLAALELKRSVKVSLTRQQMFSFGHRPIAWQKLELGAAKDGRLNAIVHKAVSETSRFETYTESIVDWSSQLYACDHVTLDYRTLPLDINTPIDMRAPGAATGMIGLECAMDELSYQLGMDPLELRVRNYADRDPSQGTPFSSKALKECYAQAAQRFGWTHRRHEPRSMRENGILKGWGMATGIWYADTKPARAKAVLTRGGKLTVSSATTDIGTGTYTLMAQIAADALGLPLADITAMIADSSLPLAPMQGGSSTAASIGMAVWQVCDMLKKKVLALAQQMPDSGLAKASYGDIAFRDGKVWLSNEPSFTGLPLTAILEQAGVESIEEKTTSLPNYIKQRKYAMNTHSAVFAEVTVDDSLGMIRVTRVVSAVAAGHIINPKTAKSQILGGIVWGISQALQEDSLMDHNFGRFMNHDLAEYHIPVHADVPEIDVIFVNEQDNIVNELGIKGVGEIGLVGVAAAIANAIFHATGKRVRDFPITIDKLL